MNLPDALALRRRLAATPRRVVARSDGKHAPSPEREFVVAERPPLEYVVRRSAKRSPWVTPFYVAVRR